MNRDPATDIRNIADDIKIGIHKAISDVKIVTHEAKSEMKKL
jgi:hypothetical protein